MKKAVWILLMTLIVFPHIVMAAEITDITVTGNNKVTYGDKVTLSFKVNVSGLKSSYDSKTGIWYVMFKLSYDRDVFDISSISSSKMDNSVYLYLDNVYVYSEILEQGNCGYGNLYCSPYEVNIDFYAKSSDKANSDITMSDVQVALISIDDDDKTYTEDDIIKLSSNDKFSKSISIIKSNDSVTISDSKDIVVEESTLKKREKKISVNEGAYLRYLLIDGYDIDFDKNKKEYDIDIYDNINSLDIRTSLENSLYSYEIIGFDDLEGNNNQVVINIIDDGEIINKYVINANKISTNENLLTDVKQKISKIVDDKNTIKYIIIGGSILFIIIIVLFIIARIRDHKLKKMVDSL